MTQTQAGKQRPHDYALPLPGQARLQGARYPEDMPQSGVLGAAMDLLEDDLALRWDLQDREGLHIDRPHAFFMGVTAEAFSFFWFPRDGQRSALDPTLCWPDPGAIYRAALGAAGYTCDTVVRPGLTTPKRGFLGSTDLKGRIVECLAIRHLPAIAAGVPSPGDFLLVTGYEEDGDVLVGWVSRGGNADVRFEPDKRVKARDWAQAADMVVLLTGRRKRPPERDSIRDALKQAERLMRMQSFGPFHAGPASFDVWAKAIVSDDPPTLEPAPAPPSVAARRRWLIAPTTWDLWERLDYAAFFLDRAIDLFPDAGKELKAARDALTRISDGMCEACRLTGSDPERMAPDVERDARLADPATRRKLAEIFAGCRDHWLEAADHLARALTAMR